MSAATLTIDAEECDALHGQLRRPCLTEWPESDDARPDPESKEKP